MKIAFIGQKGIPAISGGVEKHVDELSSRLAGLGHEVIVYTRPNYTDKKLSEYKGVKLISLPSIPTKHLDAISHTFMACLDLAFRRKADIIHFHSIGPSFLIWLLKILKPGTPIIATFHTQCYYHQKWGSFARFSLRLGEFICCKLSDKLITVSKVLKDYTREKYDRNAVYIPNGVDVHAVDTFSELAKWGLQKNEYILSVSRLVKHKGIHHLISAYQNLKTDKKLVIVGGGSYTDSYVEELKKLTGNNPNIIFTGSQNGDALKQLFSHAYLFVQPSESEGLSIALLEAMSYGKAVLVSDIPENVEAVGNTGFVFKSGDADDLRKNLEYLIDNFDLVEKSGKAGKQRVIKNYSWEMVTKEIVTLYKEILSLKTSSKVIFEKR